MNIYIETQTYYEFQIYLLCSDVQAQYDYGLPGVVGPALEAPAVSPNV